VIHGIYAAHIRRPGGFVAGGSSAPEDIPGPAGAQSLAVTFEQSDFEADGTTPIPDLYGYGLLYGTATGVYPYRKVLIDATTGTKTITATGLAAGTYFISVVTYDTSFNESYQALEISKAI
jgi:hypothetical protein